MNKIYKLPFSTADCEESPKITFVLGELILIFDYICSTGKKFAKIVFGGAICVNFTSDTLVTESMLDGYSKICEYEDSEWIEQLRKSSDQGFSSELKHYRLYFDHYGCVDVLAKNWQMNEEYDSSKPIGVKP